MGFSKFFKLAFVVAAKRYEAQSTNRELDSMHQPIPSDGAGPDIKRM